MLGQDKIPVLIAQKAQGLLPFLIPPILQMAEQAGIENFGTPNIKYPDTCLISAELQKMVDLRNNLIDKLNITADAIKLLSAPITPLNTIVTTGTKTVTTINTAISVAQITAAILPVPAPGSPDPSNTILVGLDKLNKLLTNNVNPKINKAQNIISSISMALDLANGILASLISLLNAIDVYLKKCAPDSTLTSLNDYNKNVESAANKVTINPLDETIYQGFILGIEYIPFSPTVNKVKAVARNKDGIILLQTPESFTTTPQVLIEELKLIIDKSDLKAY